MNPTAPPDYLSYLLRLWKVSDDNGRWQATLEQVGSGERRGFSSLEGLIEYLIQVTQDLSDVDDRRLNGTNGESGGSGQPKTSFLD